MVMVVGDEAMKLYEDGGGWCASFICVVNKYIFETQLNLNPQTRLTGAGFRTGEKILTRTRTHETRTRRSHGFGIPVIITSGPGQPTKILARTLANPGLALPLDSVFPTTQTKQKKEER